MKTFKETLDELNVLLLASNLSPFSDGEAKDWSIKGGESQTELKQIVSDIANELHTMECEMKDAWRYEQ